MAMGLVENDQKITIELISQIIEVEANAMFDTSGKPVPAGKYAIQRSVKLTRCNPVEVAK